MPLDLVGFDRSGGQGQSSGTSETATNSEFESPGEALEHGHHLAGLLLQLLQAAP